MNDVATAADVAPETNGRRRGRRASTDVAAVMIGGALVGIILVGVFSFFAGRRFINGAIEDQLFDTGASRIARVERDLDAIRNLTSVLAAEPAMAAALDDLAAGFTDTTATLTPEQTAELRDRYAEGLALLTPPGVEPPAASELFPVSDRADYLQYWYWLKNPEDPRSRLVDPGDGSAYSAAHARQHPEIRELTSLLELDDVLLIDANTRNIVYSLGKRADFGTNLELGPYRNTLLAEAVLDQFALGGNETVLIDFESYVPASGEPVLWVAAPIRADGALIGALAAAVPNEAVVDITTAGRNWEGTGLGDTGEIYIVGGDGLMRSESRLWIEDPEAYLDTVDRAGYDPEIGEAVAAFGTTVLIQPAETEALRSALTGDLFISTTKNYLDQETLTISALLDIEGVRWVAVAEGQTSEINEPLRSFLWRLFVVALIVIPSIVAISYVLARRLLRPIGPIVHGADAVAAGRLDVHLDESGSDEFSELASQFNQFVAALTVQQAAGIRTEAETTELLASVVPQRLIDRVRDGDRDIAESLGNATLVAISARSQGDTRTEDLVDHSVELSARLAEMAQRHGAEQLSSSADISLYATGLDDADPQIETAVAFAVEARQWMREMTEASGIETTNSIGIAAGEVVAGIVGTERMAVDVLGVPRRVALSLAGAGQRGQILVDASIAARVDSRWSLERIQDLSDLDGRPLEGWRLIVDES